MAQFDVHLNKGRLKDTVPMDQLGPCVGNLAEHGQVIADALDELLTRSWG